MSRAEVERFVDDLAKDMVGTVTLSEVEGTADGDIRRWLGSQLSIPR